MPRLAARLLGAQVATAQTIRYMAAAHRLCPLLTRHKGENNYTSDYIITWWDSFGRGVSFEGFSGEDGGGERVQNAE